jgi:Putative rhamnosyl transferase
MSCRHSVPRSRTEPSIPAGCEMLTGVARLLEHFVLTNFNIRFDFGRRDPEGELVDLRDARVRTPEWLEQRFRLFEGFCLPSLTNQTCLDFTWLLGYDPVGTPPEHQRRLRSYESAFANLRLVPEATSFSQAVAGYLGSRRCRLLTTRLDSDDALHRTAIARLQEHAAGDRLEFLNLLLGYSYSYPDGRIRLRRDENNHFLSLAENFAGGAPRTAVCVSHRRAAELAPVRQLGHRPGWLEVIHDRNLKNVLTGRPCPLPDLSEEFNVGRDLNGPSRAQATDSARGASAGAPSM